METNSVNGYLSYHIWIELQSSKNTAKTSQHHPAIIFAKRKAGWGTRPDICESDRNRQKNDTASSARSNESARKHLLNE